MQKDSSTKEGGFEDFLRWEAATRDVLDFKKIYVDIAGDVMAGLMLSELIYWHLPSKEGKSRLRVLHKGRYWVASRRYEWWDRCRFSPRQSDRAGKVLTEKGLVEKQVFKFNGEPTAHFALNEAAFLAAWVKASQQPTVNPFLPKREPLSPNGENAIPNPEGPLTETTAENKTENNYTLAANAEEGISLNDNQEEEIPLDEQAIEKIQEGFAEFAGLEDIPGKNDPRYAKWRRAYKVLAGISARNDIHPGILALSCAMKREELGFAAGWPGAYLSTAENVAAAWKDPSQREHIEFSTSIFYHANYGGATAAQ